MTGDQAGHHARLLHSQMDQIIQTSVNPPYRIPNIKATRFVIEIITSLLSIAVLPKTIFQSGLTHVNRNLELQTFA